MATMTSPEGQALRAFLGGLVPYKIHRWGAHYREDSEGAEEVTDLALADVVTSMIDSSDPSQPERHMVAIDIDLPTWLVKSSTPGHYHLYIEVPGGIEWNTYEALLFALANAGVIERGYHEASKRRRRTDLRLPWVHKP